MFLETISAISLQGSNPGLLLNTASVNAFSPPSSCNLSLLSCSSSFSNLALSRKRDNGFARYALSETATMSLTGVVFQPFEEVKRDDFIVPIVPQVSLARQRFSEECEAAINEQISVEYSVSYAYHSMYAYFDRDNVALKGLAKFFKDSSEEERDHAQKLMKYQNIRGGKVKLHTILNPPAEFEHVEKGDALYAMEIALSLEKLTNEKLLNLHSVADSNNDPQLADFIETEYLQEQVEAIKKVADYVTQLRMVGKGHGVWHFNQMLLHEGDGAL